MESMLSRQLTQLNQIYKEIDDVYHRYAKAHSLSDAALWALYSLLELDPPRTQRELCAKWSYSPQTVNSALKTLERENLIQLVPDPENRRNKRILLTAKGTALGQTVIVPLMEAEIHAFSALTEAEREALLSISRKHAAHLGEEIDKWNQALLED